MVARLALRRSSGDDDAVGSAARFQSVPRSEDKPDADNGPVTLVFYLVRRPM